MGEEIGAITWQQAIREFFIKAGDEMQVYSGGLVTRANIASMDLKDSKYRVTGEVFAVDGKDVQGNATLDIEVDIATAKVRRLASNSFGVIMSDGRQLVLISKGRKR